MDEKIQLSPEVKKFLEDLLTKAEIVPVSEEMHENMITELYIELDRYVTAKLIENMPIEHMDAFLALKKENDAQKMEIFIKKNVPDAQQLYTDAFVEFGQMYIDTVGKARVA